MIIYFDSIKCINYTFICFLIDVIIIIYPFYLLNNSIYDRFPTFEELKKIVIDNLPNNQNFCTCIKDISDGADVNGNCIHCGKSHNPLPKNQTNG